MKTFVDTLLKVLLFFGVCALATWGTFLYLASHGYWPGEPNFQVHVTPDAAGEQVSLPAALPAEHEVLLSTLVPVSAEEALDIGPSAAPAPPNVTRFLLVSLQAESDAEEGVTVEMQVKGYAETCAGSPTLGRHVQRSWHAGFSGSETLTANWCLPVVDGTTLFKRTFDDAWVADNLYPDVNYETEYLVMKEPNGAARALKLLSLAVCDDLGCGRVVSVELGADDRKLEQLLPIDDGEYVAGTVLSRATAALDDSETVKAPDAGSGGFQPVAPTM